MTRRLRSTVIARNPRASWNSMAGRIAISSSRTRLAGSGTPEPVASRIATSRWSGTPVRALSSSNVSSEYEANRLYAGSSMKSNESSPLRSALAKRSSGMDAATRLWTTPTRRMSPSENRPSASGCRIPSATRPRSSSTLVSARSAAIAISYRSTCRTVAAGHRPRPLTADDLAHADGKTVVQSVCMLTTVQPSLAARWRARSAPASYANSRSASS